MKLIKGNIILGIFLFIYGIIGIMIGIQYPDTLNSIFFFIGIILLILAIISLVLGISGIKFLMPDEDASNIFPILFLSVLLVIVIFTEAFKGYSLEGLMYITSVLFIGILACTYNLISDYIKSKVKIKTE